MIAIIGRGNIAVHLKKALENQFEVRLVNPHKPDDLPRNTDIILICVTDDAIREVAQKLPKTDTLVVHTSGSVPMETLKIIGPNFGVFYPLQTFTKESHLNYSEIPIFIEGSNSKSVDILKKLAYSFTENIFEADSEKRKKLHLASIFACNFTNALCGISAEILKDANLEFDVMLPLLKQTVKKLESMSPQNAQTGPASRGDLKILATHEDMLRDCPMLKSIYKTLSQYIISGRK